MLPLAPSPFPLRQLQPHTAASLLPSHPDHLQSPSQQQPQPQQGYTYQGAHMQSIALPPGIHPIPSAMLQAMRPHAPGNPTMPAPSFAAEASEPVQCAHCGHLGHRTKRSQKCKLFKLPKVKTAALPTSRRNRDDGDPDFVPSSVPRSDPDMLARLRSLAPLAVTSHSSLPGEDTVADDPQSAAEGERGEGDDHSGSEESGESDSLEALYPPSSPELDEDRQKELLYYLMRRPDAEAFSEPVDPVELELPDYFEVITEPMDL